MLVRLVSCLLALNVLAAVVTGCGGGESGPPLVPVVGTVTLDGKPVSTGGGVCYRDESGLVQATARIEPDGTYKLYLGRKEGAPEGKYRVVVFVSESLKEAETHNRLPILIINKKFTDPRTTPLNVEVKAAAAPGDYDLAVTR